MDKISDSELRQNLSRHLDAVTESGAPLLIKRRGKNKSLVMMPLSEFRSWQETAYLLGSRANAEQLRQSIGQVAGLVSINKVKDPA